MHGHGTCICDHQRKSFFFVIRLTGLCFVMDQFFACTSGLVISALSVMTNYIQVEVNYQHSFFQPGADFPTLKCSVVISTFFPCQLRLPSRSPLEWSGSKTMTPIALLHNQDKRSRDSLKVYFLKLKMLLLHWKKTI
jgi:hypothetical protein